MFIEVELISSYQGITDRALLGQLRQISQSHDISNFSCVLGIVNSD